MQIMITMEQILSVLQKLLLCLKVTFSQEKEISKSGDVSFAESFAIQLVLLLQQVVLNNCRYDHSPVNFDLKRCLKLFSAFFLDDTLVPYNRIFVLMILSLTGLDM